jgi:uncharacterized Zn-binding protein involved in type VI secretion
MTDNHSCPMANPSGDPHVGGPILDGSPDVDIANLPAARVTDTAACATGVDKVLTGSATVDINNLPAARMGDTTVHGGKIVEGEGSVLIGG